MLHENTLNNIKYYFELREDVIAVYLFGSTVKNKEHKDSDLDLAVLFEEGPDHYHHFLSKLQIANDLEDLIKHKIDIVDLRSADMFFVHQVMKNKILLFERHAFKRIAFEVKCRKIYFDFMPVYERYHQQSLKRLRERRN